MESVISLGWIDLLIMSVYILFVLGIGWLLKRYMLTATDFLEAGRSLPAWITGLAFISANLGALEVFGMAASGAKYGIKTVHFYWIGAIPAMIFLAIFMMPFYYGSKARSAPEYLKLRFDEKTRGLNAISFAVMTVFTSGISMFALAELFRILLGWDFNFSLLLSALIVLIYTYLGGLTSAIYNEVLQFFLIVVGFLPLSIIGLINVGGWEGLKESLGHIAETNNLPVGAYTESWQGMGSATTNPLGVHWFGLIMGLGFVLSFGYWCTNFLVVQRAMAAGSMRAARRTPLIGAIPKMFLPFLVILPGMIALKLLNNPESGFTLLQKGGSDDFNSVIPLMLGRYFPTGLLGLGFTALMASFMSGMAGNITAFNTVWTYDIYQSYINPNKPDSHYLKVGQFATIFGVIISIGTAYLAAQFDNIMDFIQLVFAFVNAPLFATFLLGMFWKRSTGHGAFYGLLAGIAAATIHHGLTITRTGGEIITGIKGGWIYVLHEYHKEMALSFWTAIWAFAVCFVFTIIVSIATQRTKSDSELKGLVYSLTPKYREEGVKWYQSNVALAIFVGAIAIILSILFW
jgi:SSS family solute:Na+ symporter